MKLKLLTPFAFLAIRRGRILSLLLGLFELFCQSSFRIVILYLFLKGLTQDLLVKISQDAKYTVFPIISHDF
jgi:hypothetical protein